MSENPGMTEIDDELEDGADRPKKPKSKNELIACGIKDAMASRQGRAWVWSMLSGFGLFASGHAADPIDAAFKAGQREVAVQLYAHLLQLCPDPTLTMIRESLEG